MDPLQNGSNELRSPADLYLQLMAACLTRLLFGERYRPVYVPKGGLKGRLFSPVRAALDSRGWKLMCTADFDQEVRRAGRDWPVEGETMIGLDRLDNLRHCIRDILDRGVPGDLMECGVWRGGASIFMRAALEAYGDGDRQVWLADSFEGLPPPDPDHYPVDTGDLHHTWRQLAVSFGEVRENFDRYGLLDGRVHFLRGWFRDTLPNAPVERLALLRLDADMYESTTEVLTNLYDKVSTGGYVVVDDYGSTPGCRAAVDDFRSVSRIDAPLLPIDWTGVYWQVTG